MDHIYPYPSALPHCHGGSLLHTLQHFCSRYNISQFMPDVHRTMWYQTVQIWIKATQNIIIGKVYSRSVQFNRCSMSVVRLHSKTHNMQWNRKCANKTTNVDIPHVKSPASCISTTYQYVLYIALRSHKCPCHWSFYQDFYAFIFFRANE